jgi:hypothetical protein
MMPPDGGPRDRLLPGEDPTTTDSRDALRWIQAYSELLGFKTRVLASVHDSLEGVVEPEARTEVLDTDLALLEGENANLHRRLDFWKRRHLELTQPAG